MTTSDIKRAFVFYHWCETRHNRRESMGFILQEAKDKLGYEIEDLQLYLKAMRAAGVDVRQDKNTHPATYYVLDWIGGHRDESAEPVE